MYKSFFVFLFLFLNFNIIYTIDNDNLLNCDLLFSENFAEKIYFYTFGQVPGISELMPVNSYIKYYQDEKKDLCLKLSNSNKTKVEKKTLIAQLYNIDSQDFNFNILNVYHEDLLNIEYDSQDLTDKIFDSLEFYDNSLNNSLVFGNEINETLIKNFGYKIINFNPAVIYNNITYISKDVRAIRSYHFDLEVPENYEAHFYPQVESGFCKIEYTNFDNKITENIYFNNLPVWIGSQAINRERGHVEELLYSQLSTTFSNEKVTIDSTAVLSINYNVNFYEWEPYCCGVSVGGSCSRHCQACGSSYSDSVSDLGIITDNYYVYVDEPERQENYKIWSEDNLIYLELFIYNYSTYKKIRVDKFLEKENFLNIIKYQFPPVDFLHYEAKSTLNKKIGNESVSVSVARYNYKSPLVEERDNSILIGFRTTLNKIDIEFETLLGNVLEYEINFFKKNIFKKVILKNNGMFYGPGEKIEITPYLMTDDGIYIDNVEIIYSIPGFKNYSETIATDGESAIFYFLGEGDIILNYPGDQKYYQHIKKIKVIRRPLLLSLLYGYIF
ncbi:MAG: hypothetical protein HRU03_01615 [Nanoarchaeales archaeon]|nr:hypothetical protein [Nanoarchaeales archaeon]